MSLQRFTVGGSFGAKMKMGGTGLGAAAALLLTCVAAQARAEAPRVRTDLVSEGANWTVNPAPHKSVQWNASRKFGFKVDVDQPMNRDADWKDVQAGAYFRLTPQLRVGGSVGLGGKAGAMSPKLLPDDAAPRVHVETAFQF